jgi:hypothetical protein
MATRYYAANYPYGIDEERRYISSFSSEEARDEYVAEGSFWSWSRGYRRPLERADLTRAEIFMENRLDNARGVDFKC